MTMRQTIVVMAATLLLSVGSIQRAQAIEVAPRISDREIIESLTELKQGQKHINKRIDALDKGVNNKIDALDNGINKRIDDLDKHLSARLDANQKMMLANHQTMLTIFGLFATLIVALFGYIAWDRQTVTKPLQERLDNLEHQKIRERATRKTVQAPQPARCASQIGTE